MILEYRLKQEKLYETVEPVVRGLGFSIVELNSRIVQRRLHVNLVLYADSGVSLDDCAKVYRTVIPRLEMVQNDRDIHLEVGSPGISRNIKAAEEFEVFKGKGVKILTDDLNEWFGGIIGSLDNGMLEILEIDETGKENAKAEFPVKNIRKAKLDDTREIRR